MDFQLTEEQILIRDMVREFVENDIKPIAGKSIKNTVFQVKASLPWLN